MRAMELESFTNVEVPDVEEGGKTSTLRVQENNGSIFDD